MEDELEYQNEELSNSVEALKKRNNELQFEIDRLKVLPSLYPNKDKYRTEVLDVEKENYALKDKIESLKANLAEKDERIVKLELENTELENQARVTESSLEDAKRKLDEMIEKLAIDKSELDELKETYQIDTERLKQQIKDMEEEIKAKDRKLLRIPLKEEEHPTIENAEAVVYKPVNGGYLKKFMSNPNSQPKSLKLVNMLLNDINSKLARYSITK